MPTEGVSKFALRSSPPMFDIANGAGRSLFDIQRLQFFDRSAAEVALLTFLQETEEPNAVSVELRPKPESLNSINGFVTMSGGERYFFKTHVEQNEQLSEYYNAELLRSVGYPVVSARQISRAPGKQFVFYEVLSYPTLFDLVKFEEDSPVRGVEPFDTSMHLGGASQLVNAQQQLDTTVFEIYQRTLNFSLVDRAVLAPINQLFHHRLSEDGRLGIFYRKGALRDRERVIVDFEQLANLRWRVNGVEYPVSLNQLIERARADLRPDCSGAIVGHGDAHNGNVFFEQNEQRLLLFDPAFAGRHSPLLDLAKPIFHNAFARWMYHPEEVLSEFDLDFRISESEICVEHTFMPSLIRQELLASRLRNVLYPTVELLRHHRLLPSSWRNYLRSALLCCPLLTVNLLAPFDRSGALAERYELPVKLLGLALSIELGASKHSGHSRLTEMIDSVFCGR